MGVDGEELDDIRSSDTLTKQPMMNEEELEVSLHTLT